MGPKDTPFEGGVFAAKLTFVSARALCAVCCSRRLAPRSRPTTRYRRSR